MRVAGAVSHSDRTFVQHLLAKTTQSFQQNKMRQKQGAVTVDGDWFLGRHIKRASCCSPGKLGWHPVCVVSLLAFDGKFIAEIVQQITVVCVL